MQIIYKELPIGICSLEFHKDGEKIIVINRIN